MNGLLPRARGFNLLIVPTFLLCAVWFGSLPIEASPLRVRNSHGLELNTRLALEQQARAEYNEAVLMHNQGVQAEQISAKPSTEVIGPGVRVWENYIAHDPAFWLSVRAPKITFAVRAWMLSTVTESDPTADPMTEYLLWRRSVAPSRFDYYHPHLGSELQNLIPPPSSSSSTGTGPSASSTPPAQPQPQLPTPSSTTTSGSVPEPSSALIALVMLGSIAFWQRTRLG